MPKKQYNFKSKKKRQEWWKSLSAEEQAQYQDHWAKLKHIKRQSVAKHTPAVSEGSCSSCVHGMVGGCSTQAELGDGSCREYVDIADVFG